MTRVKFFSNQQLSEIEKSINEFRKKEEVKQLINIKFSASAKDGNNEYTALIIYEETMTLGKEDSQTYELVYTYLKSINAFRRVIIIITNRKRSLALLIVPGVCLQILKNAPLRMLSLQLNDILIFFVYLDLL
jgi:hypothetical protein